MGLVLCRYGASALLIHLMFKIRDVCPALTLVFKWTFDDQC